MDAEGTACTALLLGIRFSIAVLGRLYPRPTKSWETFICLVWGNEQWLKNFRVTRATFTWLVDCLYCYIGHTDMPMRRAISMEEHMAITLWWLVGKNYNREVSRQFGDSKSTIAGTVVEMCMAMDLELLSRMVCLGPPGRVMDRYPSLSVTLPEASQDTYAHVPEFIQGAKGTRSGGEGTDHPQHHPEDMLTGLWE
ncbi:UNVERIFIED_CONTAM: hypothetical protein K2H54_048563 [Gekko kuhli]